jgi:hypothetical protein
MKDITVEVLVEHLCNRTGRWVFPEEVITISPGEYLKRSGHPRGPLVRRADSIVPPTTQAVTPPENQALVGPEEVKEEVYDDGLTYTKSELQQMRKAALAEIAGVSVEDGTKQEIITRILEETTDGSDY